MVRGICDKNGTGLAFVVISLPSERIEGHIVQLRNGQEVFSEIFSWTVKSRRRGFTKLPFAAI